MDRRRFLTLAGAAAAAVAATPALPARASQAAGHSEPFSFIFLTDTHMERDLGGVQGCDMAFKHARTIKADFALQGGDHIFDSLGVTREFATQMHDLYEKTQQDLGLKVHHTLGNHDCLGVLTKSGVSTGDPLYGKKMFESRFGPTYYSFDHKGVHFIVIDSIGITEDRSYEGHVDAGQIEWLKKDLAAIPAGTPIIVSTHIPLVTAFPSYQPLETELHKHESLRVGNAYEVLPLLAGHNVLAVLQGHTHINERVDWMGIPFITSGAVCGNWWKGVRMGTPEGFTVVNVANGKLTTRYETYGWKAQV